MAIGSCSVIILLIRCLGATLITRRQAKIAPAMAICNYPRRRKAYKTLWNKVILQSVSCFVTNTVPITRYHILKGVWEKWPF